MNYCYKKVRAELKDYIRSVLVLEGAGSPQPNDLPLVTNGMPALLYTSDSNHVTCFGQSVPDEALLIGKDTTLILFFFKPFSLGPILKLSAQQLKNPVDFNLWNAQKAMALTLQLHHAASTTEKLEILSDFILSQLQVNQHECKIIRYATDKMMQDSSTAVHAQLLDELNVTERTFQRIFKKYVGTTSNDYRRICQFYFSFLQLKGGHYDKLTDVVYNNGYFDQSHYTRSFKEFTDTTPNEYLQSGLDPKNE
jgi:AraC-like DNA-binding protein